MHRRPVIGVPADRKIIEPHPFHAVGEKYLKALMIAFRKKTGERATLGWLIKKLIETAVPAFLEEYGITSEEISEIEKTIKVVKKEV